MELDLSKFADKMNDECLYRQHERFAKWDEGDISGPHMRNYCTYEMHTMCTSCQNVISKIQMIKKLTVCVIGLKSQINVLEDTIKEIMDEFIEYNGSYFIW